MVSLDSIRDFIKHHEDNKSLEPEEKRKYYEKDGNEFIIYPENIRDRTKSDRFMFKQRKRLDHERSKLKEDTDERSIKI
jgi:uncharacterized beta-barrel protein YwiB (DUF1934 family)